MRTAVAISLALVLVLATGARAAVSIETVPVGNAANAPDPRTGYGAVNYDYRIGKYEVTAGQYCAFLNAVGLSDPYGLYDYQMWVPGPAYPVDAGCKIERLGTPRNYTYQVAPQWANRPVNFVCFWDAVRFANWLHNGQPTGGCDPSTTEDGAYPINGYTAGGGTWITRKPGAKWFIPSEDEWYKAAYHNNDGVTGNYWTFPTGTDLLPFNDVIKPDPGNNANFYQGGYSIGAPYFRTEAGEFENSQSPYETFDQGGNVCEYTDSFVFTDQRIVRGGAFDAETGLDVWSHGHAYPYAAFVGTEHMTGFRVAMIPEPAMLSLLALGGVSLVARRRKKNGLADLPSGKRSGRHG